MSKELQPRDVFIQYYDDQILISTPRLIISSLKESEFDKHVFLLANPDNVKLYRAGVTLSKEEAFQELRKSLNQWEKDKDPLCQYSIYRKKDGQFIGSIQFKHQQPEMPEVGYLIDKPFWKKGFGQEAVAAMIQFFIPDLVKRGYLFRNNPVYKVYATAHPDNKGSCKILENVGFTTDGIEISRYNNRRLAYTCEIPELCARLFEKKCKEINELNIQLFTLYCLVPIPLFEKIYVHFYSQFSMFLRSSSEEQMKMMAHMEMSEFDLSLYRGAAVYGQSFKSVLQEKVLKGRERFGFFKNLDFMDQQPDWDDTNDFVHSTKDLINSFSPKL